MAVQPYGVRLRLMADSQPDPSECDEGTGDEDAADAGFDEEGGEAAQKPKSITVPALPFPWSILPYGESLKVERVMYDSGALGKRCKEVLTCLGVLHGAWLAALVAKFLAQEAVVLFPLIPPQCKHQLNPPIARLVALADKNLKRLAGYPKTVPQELITMLQHSRLLLKAIRKYYVVRLSEAKRRTRLARGLRSWHAASYWFRQALDALLRSNPGGQPPLELVEVLLQRLSLMVQARETHLLQCPILGHRLSQYNMLIQSGRPCAQASSPPEGDINQPVPFLEIAEINGLWKDVLPEVDPPTDSITGAAVDLGAQLSTADSEVTASSEPQVHDPQLPSAVLELPVEGPTAMPMQQPPQWPTEGQFSPQEALWGESPGAAAAWPPFAVPGFYQHGSYAPEIQQAALFVVQPGAVEFTGQRASQSGYDHYTGEEGGVTDYDPYAGSGDAGSYDESFSHPAQDGAQGMSFEGDDGVYYAGGQEGATGYDLTAEYGVAGFYDETFSYQFPPQDGDAGGSFQEDYLDDYFPEGTSEQDYLSVYGLQYGSQTAHDGPSYGPEAEEELLTAAADTTPSAPPPSSPAVSDEQLRYFLPSGLLGSSVSSQGVEKGGSPYLPLSGTSASASLSSGSSLSGHLASHSGGAGPGSARASLPRVSSGDSKNSMLNFSGAQPSSSAAQGKRTSPTPAPHPETPLGDPQFFLPSDLLDAEPAAPTGLLDAPAVVPTRHSPAVDSSASSSLSYGLSPFTRWALPARVQSAPAGTAAPSAQATFGSGHNSAFHPPSSPTPPPFVASEGAGTSASPPPPAASSTGTPHLP
ncbi:hypothetical protein ACSSS7_006242 [Eimeria intestinalis]